MFKSFDFYCPKCAYEMHDVMFDEAYESPPHCGECLHPKMEKALNYGGYYIFGDNSGSVRPKNAGAFKKPAKNDTFKRKAVAAIKKKKAKAKKAKK